MTPFNFETDACMERYGYVKLGLYSIVSKSWYVARVVGKCSICPSEGSHYEPICADHLFPLLCDHLETYDGAYYISPLR